MLRVTVMPISVITLVCFAWTLDHVFTYWLCAYHWDDIRLPWVGGPESPIAPLVLWILAAALLAGFAVVEWIHERVHLGVRDWKRSVIHGLAVFTALSWVLCFERMGAFLALF
jgi:hypothetical protein